MWPLEQGAKGAWLGKYRGAIGPIRARPGRGLGAASPHLFVLIPRSRRPGAIRLSCNARPGPRHGFPASADTKSSLMAEPEVEAAWRDEFKRIRVVVSQPGAGIFSCARGGTNTCEPRTDLGDRHQRYCAASSLRAEHHLREHRPSPHQLSHRRDDLRPYRPQTHGARYRELYDANSASNAFASFRSRVSKPSVNQP
jgi:hypothetical protein